MFKLHAKFRKKNLEPFTRKTWWEDGTDSIGPLPPGTNKEGEPTVTVDHNLREY